MENAITEKGKWKILKSEYLFRRPWLTVRRDCVELPDGRQNPEFYILEYPDWVNVIAITDDGQFVMERQYRHGSGKLVLRFLPESLKKAKHRWRRRSVNLWKKPAMAKANGKKSCPLPGTQALQTTFRIVSWRRA